MLQIPKNPVFMRLSEKFKVLHCGVTSCYRCYASKKKAIENPENVKGRRKDIVKIQKIKDKYRFMVLDDNKILRTFGKLGAAERFRRLLVSSSEQTVEKQSKNVSI